MIFEKKGNMFTKTKKVKGFTHEEWQAAIDKQAKDRKAKRKKEMKQRVQAVLDSIDEVIASIEKEYNNNGAGPDAGKK